MARLSGKDITTLLDANTYMNERIVPFLEAEKATLAVKVSVADVTVHPTATQAVLKIKLSAPPRDTIIGSYNTRNGVGAWEGGTYVKASGPFIFHPGDPLEKDIIVQLKPGNKAGWTIELLIGATLAGATLGDAIGLVKFSTETVEPVPSGFRLKYQSNFVDGFEVTDSGVSADGVTRCWQSRPDHGRTQAGNKELGLYIDPVLYPATNPFPIVDGKRRLRSEYFPDGVLNAAGQTTPCPWNIVSGVVQPFRHTASMITTRMLPEARLFPGGRIEARFACPVAGQRGAWPAFWLLSNEWPHVWPPELDILEQPVNADYKPFIYYSTQHWTSGGHQSRGYPIDVRLLGIPGVMDCTHFHTYGMTITDSEINFDFDGKRTATMENRSPGKSWYILLNMAMGGGWPGSPNAGTVFPVDMILDWIKIYEPV